MVDYACSKSRTSYVILVVNCPITLQFKLQSETILPTLEANIAISHSCYKLCPIIDGGNIIDKVKF